MHAEFALIDQAFFGFVHKLDGVFDGDDVTFKRIVQIVHHRGKRGGFAGACRSGHQDQPLFLVAELPKDRWHAEFFQRKNVGRNVPKDGA